MKENPNQKKTLVCPDCDNEIIKTGEIATGTIVECPACATESEIISLTPLTLAPLEEEK